MRDWQEVFRHPSKWEPLAWSQPLSRL